MKVIKRLSHLDAAILAFDTPTNHMHLGLLAVFEPVADGVDILGLLRKRLDEAAEHHPEFHSVVRSGGFGLAAPVLIDSGSLDHEYHVRWTTLLTVTDSTAALDDWVARELSIPLDRSKPLWRTHVGFLSDGSFALLFIGHHAIFDGSAALRHATELLDEVKVKPPEPLRRRSDGRSGRAGAALGSLLDLWYWPGRIARNIADPTRHATRLGGLPSDPRPFRAPRTPVNISIGTDRAIRRVELSKELVAHVRRSADCTATDVVLAVVSTSVRQLLSSIGALPSEPLVAIVSAPQAGDDWRRRSANRIAFWFISLGTDIAQPHERLASIARSSKKARAQLRLRGADLWDRLAGAVLPGPLHGLCRVLEASGIANRLRPLGSLTVSNLAGPHNRLSLGGAAMTSVWPFGPPKDGASMSINVVSYEDSMYVGLQADDSLAEHLDAIAAGLAPALDELSGVVSRAARL